MKETAIAQVTIVRAEGSTYRRAGARMLVGADGSTEGSIRGGCLEADAVARALAVLETGEPVLAVYDTRDEGDAVWGHGLGCSGLVEALVEPAVPAARAWGRLAAGVALVYRVEGEVAARVGARASVADGHADEVTGVSDAALAARLLEDAREAMRSGRSRSCAYRVEGGRVEAFVEAIRPVLSLVVFGAGHDAVPLVDLAARLGWRVTVVDHRPAFARAERLPGADRVALARPEAARDLDLIEAHTAAVVMTHNYMIDYDLLGWLVDEPAFYLGLLGPKRRAERLLSDLGRDGHERIYAPVGLDVGAETPEEIALAAVAEIQATRAGRAGGSLRDRAGRIHQSLSRAGS